MSLRIPGMVLLLSFVLSCTNFSNNINATRLECGIAEKIPEDQVIVKILKDDGSNLSGTELSTLQGRLLPGNGPSQSLSFTDRGCLIVNKGSQPKALRRY